MSRKIEYRNCTVVQNSNNHVIIFQNNEMVFHASVDKNYYEQLINGNWWDIRAIDIEDRCLLEFTEEVGYWTFTDDDELLSITFDDLIKADLVEEVEDG